MASCADLWLSWRVVEAYPCVYTDMLGGLFHVIYLGIVFGALYVGGRSFGLPAVVGILLSGYVIQTLPAGLQLPAYVVLALAAGIILYRAYSNPTMRGL